MDYQELVGKSLWEARTICEKDDIEIRVTELNGESVMSTLEFNPNRINVGVSDGLVISLHGVG